MLERHPHSRTAVRVRVTVTDMLGVQRLLTMLTGRAYQLTRFEADEHGAGRWRATVDLVAAPEEVEVLEARLHRLPSVLLVDVTMCGARTATA